MIRHIDEPWFQLPNIQIYRGVGPGMCRKLKVKSQKYFFFRSETELGFRGQINAGQLTLTPNFHYGNFPNFISYTYVIIITIYCPKSGLFYRTVCYIYFSIYNCNNFAVSLQLSRDSNVYSFIPLPKPITFYTTQFITYTLYVLN